MLTVARRFDLAPNLVTCAEAETQDQDHRVAGVGGPPRAGSAGDQGQGRHRGRQLIAPRLQHREGEGGQEMVRFEIHPRQRKRRPSVECTAEVVGERMVKNPGGRAERRPVIRTTLVVAGEEIEALVNLTTRDEMTFRMLLGRRTLRKNFVVDPGRSYLGERPKRDGS